MELMELVKKAESLVTGLQMKLNAIDQKEAKILRSERELGKRIDNFDKKVTAFDDHEDQLKDLETREKALKTGISKLAKDRKAFKDKVLKEINESKQEA